MSFNRFWLQILFCSCVNETTFFSFLRSLLRENGRSLVLGPVLFLAYINDITTGVRSSMRLFTDDCKVYRIIYVKTTRNNLNVTSTRYTNGAKIGNFVFTLTNVGFYVLPVREIILCSSPYKLSGCTLQSVTETVDLGVSLTSNLS